MQIIGARKGGWWARWSPVASPTEKNIFSLYRRLGGPRCRSKRAQNIVFYRESIPGQPAHS